MDRPYKTADSLTSVNLGRSGELQLEALRPVVHRVNRLAERMFDAFEADVVIAQDGKVWRGKASRERTDDQMAAQIAMEGEHSWWLEDSHADPRWRDDPQTHGPDGIRFCAIVPIRLKSGFRLGALRVFGKQPRPRDEDLIERLKDLAAFVADECDRLVAYETRVIREMFEQAPGFMAVMNGPDYLFEMVNPAFVALVGPRPMIGLSARDVLPGLLDQGFFMRLDEVMETGRPFVGRGFEMLLERQPGRVDQIYADFVLQPIFDSAGAVSSIFMQGSDVTQEILSRGALRASQAELEAALDANQAVIDNSIDVISTIDADGIFTQVSKHAFEVWGYRPDELIGQRYMDYVHPEDRSATQAAHNSILAGKPTSSFKNRYLHRDGSEVPMMWSSAWSERHGVFFTIARDISESVLAEERLRRAQKMEAVGRLTGGVAHDFNNLLTIIIGGSEALTEGLQPGTELYGIAKLIFDAGERGADLVRRLLTFARSQELDSKPIDTGVLLGSLERLIQRTIGENVEVSVSVSEPLACRADRAQLESALLNLAINARDAMPNGGRLSIEVRAAELTAADVENATMKPGQYVHFSVSDTGQGMDTRTLERAIEPFFTTKDIGKGTGLGLAMVYSFVTQSGGGLRLRSTLGVGTRVDIFLPRAALSEVVAPGETTPGLRHVAATILAVEDDDMVRAHSVKLLRAMGYQVLESENAARALEVLKSRQDVDLLFTDIVMPGGMNGCQLADSARQLRPTLRVLFTTGYAEEEILKSSGAYSPGNVLRKPYRRAELARLVAGTLEGGID